MARQPKKVLHVMNAAAGGAALSTLALMRALEARGIGACAVCNEGGTAEEKQALVEATHGEARFTSLYWWNAKIRAKAWKRPLLEARQWVKTGARLGSVAVVAKAARDFGADLLHTNTILTPDAAHAARLLGLPHAWHVRELTGPEDPFRLPLEGEALRKVLERDASVLIANSHVTASKLPPHSALRVIPNGLELQAFRGPRLERTRPVVGMVANVTSRTKKHALFLAAAKLLAGLDVDWRLYGHAPEGDAYVGEVKAQAGAVAVMGFAEAPLVMRELDVLVHPADNESFGRTVVEAMAAGVPVVGANGGGVAETIEDGVSGLLFRPDDAGHLAAQLRRVLEDAGLRKALVEGGRARAQARYSMEACAEAVAEAYAVALDRPLRASYEALRELRR